MPPEYHSQQWWWSEPEQSSSSTTAHPASWKPLPPPPNAYGSGTRRICSCWDGAGLGCLPSLSKDIVVIDGVRTKSSLIIDGPSLLEFPRHRKYDANIVFAHTPRFEPKFTRIMNYVGPEIWPTKSRGNQREWKVRQGWAPFNNRPGTRLSPWMGIVH